MDSLARSRFLLNSLFLAAGNLEARIRLSFHWSENIDTAALYLRDPYGLVAAAAFSLYLNPTLVSAQCFFLCFPFFLDKILQISNAEVKAIRRWSSCARKIREHRGTIADHSLEGCPGFIRKSALWGEVRSGNFSSKKESEKEVKLGSFGSVTCYRFCCTPGPFFSWQTGM